MKIIIEMKISLGIFNSIFDQEEERISELEDGSIEIIQSEELNLKKERKSTEPMIPMRQ